ncbi:MAG: HAD-IC family P-type ATPase, partial [Bacilli bacterium]|nr:HAD-IC family P-type ATPase [Bacilli bacterium]
MWETKSNQEIIKKLCADSQNGLSSQEAQKRLDQNGPNELKEAKRESLFKIFIRQFNDPMIYILIAAAVISLVVGIIEQSTDWIDSIIIFFVIFMNATIGTVQENKANQAMDALKKMSSPTAIVRRDGKIMEIKAKDLVIGDIVIIEEGNVIPADIRLLSSANFKSDESSLTGESLPVLKSADVVLSKETGIADRVNMAFMSSICVYGRGEGIVVETGMGTEIGRIASLLNKAETNLTPLQKKLNELSKVLGYVTIGIVIVMLTVSLFRVNWGADTYWDEIIQSFLLAISLAVAAVPEGLTAVVTIVLSIGVQRMADAHTIVRKLPSVETLGAVDVV